MLRDINEKYLLKQNLSFQNTARSQNKEKGTQHTHTLALNHEQVACSHLVAISGNKVTFMSPFNGSV